MDVFLGIVLMLGGMAAVGFLVLGQYRRYKAKAYLNLPKQSPVSDSCVTQARKMVTFLRERLDEADPANLTGNKQVASTILKQLDDSHDLVDLARLVHLGGCHIVVEQVPEGYVEGSGATGDPEDVYVTDLKRSYEERMVDKYSRRY